jgi:hypothetical protein
VKPELCVQVSRTRFRIPNITSRDRSDPIEQIITHAPIAVVEALSPEDTTKRRCGNWAIPQPWHSSDWAIDPETKIYFSLSMTNA